MIKTYKVYCYISPSNKRYVGITKNTLQQRAGANGQLYKHNTYFYKAIKKYGWNNFQKIILFDNLTQDIACDLERFYIRLWNTCNSDYGYNLTFGGEANIPNEHTRKLISLHHADIRGPKNPFWGKCHSHNSKLLISQNHDYSKQTGQNSVVSRCPVCLETGLIYGSASLADKIFVDTSTCIIQSCCKNLKLYRGLHFIYYDDLINLYENDLPTLIQFINKKPKLVRKDMLQEPLTIDIHSLVSIIKTNYNNQIIMDAV